MWTAVFRTCLTNSQKNLWLYKHSGNTCNKSSRLFYHNLSSKLSTKKWTSFKFIAFRCTKVKVVWFSFIRHSFNWKHHWALVYHFRNKSSFLMHDNLLDYSRYIFSKPTNLFFDAHRSFYSIKPNQFRSFTN